MAGHCCWVRHSCYVVSVLLHLPRLLATPAGHGNVHQTQAAGTGQVLLAASSASVTGITNANPTQGLLTGESFDSSTGTGSPGHPCICLGIPSGIPASAQAFLHLPRHSNTAKSNSQLQHKKTLPSLGCQSPGKSELTSPALTGAGDMSQLAEEAKPPGLDPACFPCELGGTPHEGCSEHWAWV